MDIKRIPALQPFQVNTTSETTDDPGRRERDQSASKKKTTVAKPPEPEKSAEFTAEANELCRQIVDSEKVIQLLEQRPKASTSARKRLQRIQSSRPLSAQQKSTKHVNRTL